MTGEHPVQQYAQPVHVGGGHDRVARQPLRCHVGRGAEQHRVAVGELTDRGGDAEVDDLGLPVRRDHDVGRLHIAVHDAVLVRGTERRGHLRADAQHVGHRQRTVFEALGQRLAGEQLHHDVRNALAVVMLTEVEDPGDVRVSQLRDRLGLGPDAPAGVPVGDETWGEDLHRHLTVEHLVVGTPDDGHTAFSEALDQSIPTGQHVRRVHRDSLHHV
ncbi:hypothetical protein GCM10009558_035640 [Virgisporangium aurantiacum]